MPSHAAAASGSKTRWAWAVGTFFGVGLPRAGKGMGTLASAITVLLWYAAGLKFSNSSRPPIFAASTGIAALLVALIGIPAGTIVAREIGVEDPSQVVIDEVAGQLIALIAAPLDWKYAVAAFILFRVFDMTKPPPVRNLERLHGGLGIMMDDVAAGALALILLRLGNHLGII